MNTEDYTDWVHGKRHAAAAGWREHIAAYDRLRECQNKDKPADQFDIDVNTVMAEASELLIRKHHDYGPRNVGQSPGGPLNGLRVRIWDKVARINNLIDSGAEPENESLRDSFIDALNYCAIALLVLDGRWPE